MKKTIIITISMLAVFSFLAWVSANQLTNKWQTPRQDEMELSVSSPVEIVEKEYKEYPYTLLNEAIDKDSNISPTEAVGIIGETVKQIFSDMDFSKLNIYLSFSEELNGTYSISADSIWDDVQTDKINSYGFGEVEATTGEIKNLFFVNRRVSVYTTDEDDAKAVSISPDVDYSALTEVMTEDEQKKVLTQALEYTEKIGYSNYKKYYIEKSISKDWGNYYTVYLQDNDGNVEYISFEYNEGYPNTSVDFQNNIKGNTVEYLQGTILEKLKNID